MSDTRATRRFLKRITLLVVSVLVTLLVAEITLQFAYERTELSSSWRFIAPETPSRDLIHVHDRFLDDGYYELYRDTDKPLLVALGDSFTAGYNVGTCLDPRQPGLVDNSYPTLLGRQLAQKGVDVQVMNAGAGDTGPGQHLRLFKDYILRKSKPDVVIWQFCANDAMGNAMMPVFSTTAAGDLQPLDAGENWLYRRQELFESIPLPRALKRKSCLVHLVMKLFEHDRAEFVPEQHKSDPALWGLQKIRLQVDSMNELARKHDFRVYYLLIAPQARFLADTNSDWAEFWETKDYSRILSVLETEPAFMELEWESREARAAPGNSDIPLALRIFSSESADSSPIGSRHLNVLGYSLVADQIADRLLTDGIFPDAPGILHDIRFGTGDELRYLRGGWSLTEAAPGELAFSWAEGKRSRLSLPLDQRRPLKMILVCKPFSFPGAPGQILSTFVNSRRLPPLLLQPGYRKYSMEVPADMLTVGANQIEFGYSYASKPKDVLKGSGDERDLAVAWRSITIVQAGR